MYPPSIRTGEYGTVVRRLPKARRKPLLLLSTPMLPQLGNNVPGQGNHPASVLGLRGLNSNAVGDRLLKRARSSAERHPMSHQRSAKSSFRRAPVAKASEANI